MVDPNLTSRLCWAYESTPREAEITAVNDTTYYFGDYLEDMKKFLAPAPEHPVQPYRYYNSREVGGLTDLDAKYPTFKTQYAPVSAQFLSWMLKSHADNTPAADTFAVLDTGMTYPLTIRLEQAEGTNPNNFQAVGCYNVGLYIDCALGSPVRAESEWAYCSFEDLDDNDGNLTTAPVAPAGLSGTYDGCPNFKWNSNLLAQCVRVRLMLSQKWESVYDPATGKQVVYCYEYEAPQIIFSGVLEVNTVWDDFIGREARAAQIKCYKADVSTYFQIDITNVKINQYRNTGVLHKGHYEVEAICTGEAVTAEATTIADDGTHYKGTV